MQKAHHRGRQGQRVRTGTILAAHGLGQALLVKLAPGKDLGSVDDLHPLRQLDAVSEGILDECAPSRLDRLRFRGLESLLPASIENTVKIADEESRMSLGRGPEVLLHAEMNLHGSAFERATAARGRVPAV